MLILNRLLRVYLWAPWPTHNRNAQKKMTTPTFRLNHAHFCINVTLFGQIGKDILAVERTVSQSEVCSLKFYAYPESSVEAVSLGSLAHS